MTTVTPSGRQPEPQGLPAVRNRPASAPAGLANGPSFEALLARAKAAPDRGPWAGAGGRLGARLDSSNVPLAGRTGSVGSPLASFGSLGSLAGLAGGPEGAGGFGALASPAGQAVVEAAKTHLGVPYLWGGTDPEKGFDCSGLIQDAYRQIGVEMPKWSRHQATMGIEVESLDQALPGDVLSFGQPVSHVALYVGDGQMLHAPRRGEVVKIEPIDRTIGSIRRIVSPAFSPTPGSAFGPGSALDPGYQPVSAAERRYQPLFEAAGRRHGIDPTLLAAIAETESAFDPGATSRAGAQGLMQFMPATAAEMGVDPWDPASAVDGAARYLLRSIDQFDTVEEAIASYNAGRGAVSRYGGVPPFTETEHYVQKVLDAWRNRQ